MEIETDIIMSIEASPIRRAVILVVMYVLVFTTGIIVFISNISHAFGITLTNYFQYQSQFIDTNNITCKYQRKTSNDR